MMWHHSQKLCLGTVQFGMRYGIHNTLGRQPSPDECFDILQTALELDISFFDTASSYGDAEKILGEFGLASKKTKSGDSVHIISKLRPYCEDSADAVLREIDGSLRRLNTDVLSGYLLHRASDIERDGIMRGMQLAKAKGFVKKIGVSVYEPGEAMQAICDSRVDIIQIPYNVLDKRMETGMILSLSCERHKEIFARSVFLQGLLLMDPSEAEQRVPGVGIHVLRFQRIADCYGFSPLEAAFMHSVCNDKIDWIVFGVDDSSQLRTNVDSLDRWNEFIACNEELQWEFNGNELEREILLPSLWRRQKA